MESINSDINIIGSIPGFSLIQASIERLARRKCQVDLKELVFINNTFDCKTERAGTRFLSAFSESTLLFKNDNHETLIESLFNAARQVIFWPLLFGKDLPDYKDQSAQSKIVISGRPNKRCYSLSYQAMSVDGSTQDILKKPIS